MNARDKSFLGDGHLVHRPHLPDVFCWTKIGAEAGQTLGDILRRKEFERIAGNGRFGWGIGNALGESPRLAMAAIPQGRLKVVFSTMKSPPKTQDVTPSQICIWTNYQLPNGEISPVDRSMLITSRYSEKKVCHYALICSSSTSLLSPSHGRGLSSRFLRNFLSNKPVGASQVTSIVSYQADAVDLSQGDYPITFTADLDGPGFVRLVNPVLVEGDLYSMYRNFSRQTEYSSWQDCMSQIWQLIEAKSNG